MRLFIFDVDGTLLDSQQHILTAQRDAFAAIGLAPPTRERSIAVVGLSLHEAFTELAGPDAPLDALAEAYKAAWFALVSAPGYREVLYPGAADLVADLAARHDLTLGIATGKSIRGVDRVLAAHGWQTTFATVQTADTHPSKPHPSMIEAALAETGIAAHSAVMIGDTTYDIDMAVAAGIEAIGVAWGFHPREALRASGAKDVAEDFAQLRHILGVPRAEAA